jgi:hypothetical protein
MPVRGGFNIPKLSHYPLQPDIQRLSSRVQYYDIHGAIACAQSLYENEGTTEVI